MASIFQHPPTRSNLFAPPRRSRHPLGLDDAMITPSVWTTVNEDGSTSLSSKPPTTDLSSGPPWGKYSDLTLTLQKAANQEAKLRGYCGIKEDGKLGAGTCGLAQAVDIFIPTCQGFTPPTRCVTGATLPQYQDAATNPIPTATYIPQGPATPAPTPVAPPVTPMPPVVPQKSSMSMGLLAGGLVLAAGLGLYAMTRKPKGKGKGKR